ncbi:MAG: potassium-transporting ATPase subunit KdpC [Pseudomonadota bacterium]
MFTLLRPAGVLFAALTLLCGLCYPYAVAGLGQALFPAQANGSLLVREGRAVGSALIGQSFTAPRYVWGRPSATVPMANNGAGSGGSNLGPLNPAQLAAVRARIAALQAADPANRLPIPVDLVTASASGLDPELSVAAARYQAARVARARRLPLAQVDAIIADQRRGAWLGWLGEPRVNVLALNLALDAASNRAAR